MIGWPDRAPRVSILLPCRDAGSYLSAAIHSVRTQTFEDYEVVAVDDGSTDGSGERLNQWALGDRRVRPLSTPPRHRGLVPALARGLAAARGELVARMDADDVADPERLRKQVELLDGDRGLAACGTLVDYFPAQQVRDGALRYQRWINSLVEPEHMARDVFVECPLPHPTLMVRRNLLVGLGGYRELGWPEDYDLVLRLWQGGYRMAKVPEVLYHWREGDQRASRTDPRYDPAQFRRVKIHFLRRTLLAGDRPAILWGAGPIGKTWSRELSAAGTPLAAFVDIDPNKVGQQIHDAPVLAPEQLPRFLAHHSPSPLILAAVGQEGARAEIRGECERLGLVEGDHFVAVA